MGRSVHKNNGNEGVLHNLQISKAVTSLSDCLLSREDYVQMSGFLNVLNAMKNLIVFKWIDQIFLIRCKSSQFLSIAKTDTRPDI